MLPHLCGVLGLPRFTNNAIRPTSIQAMKRAEFSDREIQNITGHRDANSLRHYDPNLTDAVAQKISNAISNTGLDLPVPKDNESGVFRRPTKRPRQASATITSYNEIPESAIAGLDDDVEIDNDPDWIEIASQVKSCE